MEVVLVLDYVFTVCHKEWAIVFLCIWKVPWQPEDLPSVLHSRRILTMCKVCVKIFLCVVMAIGIDTNKENPTKSHQNF
jgi:hypothetical protein